MFMYVRWMFLTEYIVLIRVGRMRFADGPSDEPSKASKQSYLEGRRDEMLGTSPEHTPMHATGKTNDTHTPTIDDNV